MSNYLETYSWHKRQNIIVDCLLGVDVQTFGGREGISALMASGMGPGTGPFNPEKSPESNRPGAEVNVTSPAR